MKNYAISIATVRSCGSVARLVIKVGIYCPLQLPECLCFVRWTDCDSTNNTVQIRMGLLKQRCPCAMLWLGPQKSFGGCELNSFQASGNVFQPCTQQHRGIWSMGPHPAGANQDPLESLSVQAWPSAQTISTLQFCFYWATLNRDNVT